MSIFPLEKTFAISLFLVVSLVVGGCQKSQSVGALEESEDSPSSVELTQEASLPQESSKRSDVLARAAEDLDQLRYAEAIEGFRQLVLVDSQDYEALYYLANAHAAQGNLSDAIAVLGDIPSDHSEGGLPALSMSADLSFQMGRYADAETHCRKILEIDPASNLTRRKLAYLFNRQGRRHEAVQLIRQLCSSGDVMQDELHALIIESDAIHDLPGELPAANTRPYWPIGKSGHARYLFTEKKYREAADEVHDLVASGKTPASIVAFYGIAVAEAQDSEKFSWWLQQVTPAVKEFPEYWSAVGTYLVSEAKYRPALRAFAEALQRDPTDYRSIRRIVQAFRSIDQPDQEDAWTKRFEAINRTATSGGDIADSTGNPEQNIEVLAQELDGLGRRIEAVMWRSIAAMGKPNLAEIVQSLNQERINLLANEKGFPSGSELWCGFDFDRFALPDLSAETQGLATQDTGQSRFSSLPTILTQPRFRDVASEIGLVHRYRVAENPESKGFTLYQSWGGGVAVVDYDLNGYPDLYFAQGAANPPEFKALQSDMLYRNTSGDAKSGVLDVTTEAGITDREYTIGVTSGDWNQDGFPDIAISNMRINRLLVNQGDGTFIPFALDAKASRIRADTSLAMGDMTGDHLPDLFVLSFMNDEKITQLPDRDDEGNVVFAIPPSSVTPSVDHVYVNAGDGSWDWRPVGKPPGDACTGLGIVLSNFDSMPGNEAFVGNDGRKNQLWFQTKVGELVDRASLMGCAYGSLGASTAAMGIAAGDLDRNGLLDLHIGNYLHEPVSLYLQQDGLFRDLNVRHRLSTSSKPVVGFGSQAIDYDHDGWLDLVIINGHIESLEHLGEPYRQQAQLFANRGDHFEMVDIPNSHYWSQPHLGRALATLDFDRNGQQDIVMTDLLDDAELLFNETLTPHRWIEFQLVGRLSERDAIGAKVEIVAGNDKWSAWVTAGDGYLCKNESVLHFGLGQETAVESILITWPSGAETQLRRLASGKRYIVIEGDEAAF